MFLSSRLIFKKKENLGGKCMFKFNKKALIMFVLMLAVALVAGCGGQKAAETPKTEAPAPAPVATYTEPATIKIGFLGALTGSVASYGQNTLDGMKLAADEINAAGGVNGKQIEIIENDNRGDKTEGANITQKYVTQDKVVAIVGDPTTGITKVAAPIANQNKVVIMSAGSTGPGVVEIGPYVFRDTLLDSVGGPTTIKYMVEKKGWKKVALITSINNDFSVGLSKIFKDGVLAAGGEIATEENISDGDTDFSAQVTNIKSKGAQVIIFSGYYTEGALIMKEVRKQGLKDIVMVGGDGLQSPVLWELGGAAVEGSISYAGFSPEQPTPTTAKFIENFKKKYSKDPDLFHAQGYDAIQLFAAAITKAGTANPEKWKDTLAATQKFDGVSGNISFGANREPIKSPVFLLEVKGAKFSLLEKVPVVE
jgi:branched-chain amino acid transport system substrate-binding protein